MLGKIKARREADNREWDGWMVSLNGHEFKQALGDTKGKNRHITITVGYFNTLHSVTDISSRQKSSNTTAGLNRNINQFDLIYIHEILIQLEQNIHCSQIHIEHSYQ